MLRTFTVWQSPPGLTSGDSVTLVAGTDPPRGVNGRELEPGAVLIHRFKAASPDEAMAKFHEFMGYEPYRPMVDGQGRPYPEDAAPFETAS